ncbi:MAG: GrdX family protein [Oscillospiraceae bacterium]|nr:GrdX family protein [Oscillospiraceae bacterium]
MKLPHRIRIITNNPLVNTVLSDWYKVEFHEDASYRDILVMVRDMVYNGYELMTHPMAGSVKPNETMYKSIVVGTDLIGTNLEHCNLMMNALITCDKFKPLGVVYSDYHIKDFQLIDYTLLCGALDFDAIAGLSKANVNSY